MKTKFKIIFSLACMLPMLSSCVYEAYDVGEGGYTGDGVEINLQILTSGMSTRATGQPQEKGEDYESAINVSGGDYAIFVFDGSGNYLSRFEPGQILVNNFSTTTVNGVEYYTYHLSGVFEPGEGVGNVQMLVLSNWQTLGGNYYNLENYLDNRKAAGDVPTIDELFTTTGDFNFDYASKVTGGKSWTPKGNPGIPMTARTPVYPVSQNIDLGSVNALRSLAKIEIVDKAPRDGAKITSCVLTGYNTTGRFMPIVTGTTNPGWNDPDTQVLTTSFPAAGQSYQASELECVVDTRMVVPEGEEAEQLRNVYSFYIPEMEINTANPPVIKVLVEGSQEYVIELSDYLDGKPKPNSQYTSILRNHLYRFNVLDVGSNQLDFIIETPWQQAEGGEWEYEDFVVTFEGGKEFAWDWTNVDEDTQLPKYESGQLIERMIVISQDNWLEGVFKLVKPSKGKWTISLYGDDNTLNDHFFVQTGVKTQMVDEEGETYYTYQWGPGAPSISGNVGEEIMFRIIPSAVNNSDQHYTARVVFTVTTFDDQVMEVNLPYFDGKQFNVQGNEMTMPTLANNGYFFVKQYYSGFKDVIESE